MKKTILETVHEAAQDLYESELIDEKTMQEFDALCLPSLRKRCLSFSPEAVFADIREKHSEAGAYLKGIRLREGLNQAMFAKCIGVTQGDLSQMENGKRPIEKKLAQKIGKLFDFDYRNLL